MDRNNRPRGREKNVTSGSGNVFKRGQGLGTGPVGASDGYAGKNASQGNQYSSYNPERETGTPRRTRAGGSSSLMRVVIILGIMALVGGGGGLSGLFGGSAGTGTGNIQQQTTPPSQSQGTGNQTQTQNVTDTGAGQLDTEVAKDARAKRTEILGGGKDTATIMVYMCGTDLESRSGMATNDLREMMEADFGDNINLLVYTGGCNSWRNNAVSSRTNQIWQVKDNDLNCLENDLGAKPMTDAATLSSFIQYCAENFPANRNQLIFWDHGGGSVSGYGYDEKFKSSGGMSLAGIQKALKDGGITFDYVGFDTCLMATVENALMLDEFADYMIASEETEPGIGWYYTNWLTQFGRNTSMSTPELGKLIIDEFTRACNVNCRGQKTTLSITDLAELSATVPDRLSAFSKSISGLIQDKEYKTVSDARYQTREFAQSSRIDQVDLVHLAQNMGTEEGRALADALNGAVKYNRCSANMSNAYGLSIYFPYQRAGYVDSAVNTYSQIGMDSDYANAIREFAALETSGQVVAGGTGSPVPSLLGTLMEQGGGTGLSSADMIGSLLTSFMGGGDFSAISGLTGANTEFLFGRSMPDDELADYLAEYQFDRSNLAFRSNGQGGFEISMPEEQWDLIHSVDLQMFYDDGTGYIDLGWDNVYEFDDEGDLQAPEETTWLAINGQTVAYYHLDTTEDGDSYQITGRVPALLNGEYVNLILVFDNETPGGYVAGVISDYKEGETDTVAKMTLPPEAGDTLDFICDYYSYDGTYEESYMLGEQMTVTDDGLTVSDTVLSDGSAVMSFRFTDLYHTEYWTESLSR
ncbi:MAG: peptidase C11 [Butyrivibrio sp.]|nr:peptidase C11 [Butyrivibrio sp.]